MYGTSLTKTIGWVWLSNRVRKQTEALGKKEREKKEMATKFNTLFRSKDTQEAQDLVKESIKAISVQADDPHKLLEWDEDSEIMVVGEERMVLAPRALEEPAVVELTTALLNWLNDSLEGRRIIVRDIVEDLYDGQILGELLSELMGEGSVSVVPVTQSSYMQKNKLRYLLDKVDRLLGLTEKDRSSRWTVQSVHSKDVVSILHLLVALSRHFRSGHTLPRNVTIKRIFLKQLENKLDSSIIVDHITGDDVGPTTPITKSNERDVFDKLFEEAPEKLEPVKRSLCQFCSKVLQEMDISITDLNSQFHDGVNLVLMVGLLEGYFIPLYQWHYTPRTNEEKMDNMKLAFSMLKDAGLPQTRPKPEELVFKDLKSTLRVLYSVFGKYKSRFQQQPAAQKQPVATSDV